MSKQEHRHAYGKVEGTPVNGVNSSNGKKKCWSDIPYEVKCECGDVKETGTIHREWDC